MLSGRKDLGISPSFLLRRVLCAFKMKQVVESQVVLRWECKNPIDCHFSISNLKDQKTDQAISVSNLKDQKSKEAIKRGCPILYIRVFQGKAK